MNRHRAEKWLPYAACAIAIGLLVFAARRALARALTFDDAYMFYRYATNVRNGWGVSWNPDGVHTYGQTSLGWLAVIFFFTFLPTTPERALMLASWSTCALAMAAMAWVVTTEARSRWLRRFPLAFASVCIPLVLDLHWRAVASNGMDSMAGVAANTCILASALCWMRAPSTARAMSIGAAAWLAFFVRPESGIASLSLLLATLAFAPRNARKTLLPAFATFGAAVGAQLLACRLYFGIALPLSFYVKSVPGFYAGYRQRWEPFGYLVDFLRHAGPWIVALAAFARRASLRYVVPCLAAFATVSFYLLNVTQIMAMYSRYYVPYLPYLLVPALLVVDDALARYEESVVRVRPHLARIFGVALAAWFVSGLYSTTWISTVDDVFERPTRVYPEVHLCTNDAAPLPEIDWFGAQKLLAGEVLEPLPRGATIAATEVGALSAHAPNVIVFDVAGLNDPDVRRVDYTPLAFLDHRPDLILLPHPDYTHLRGKLLTSPGFLANYTVYADALLLGVAIRKDSAYRTQIDAGFTRVWRALYGSRPMEDHVATCAEWIESTN